MLLQNFPFEVVHIFVWNLTSLQASPYKFNCLWGEAAAGLIWCVIWWWCFFPQEPECSGASSGCYFSGSAVEERCNPAELKTASKVVHCLISTFLLLPLLHLLFVHLLYSFQTENICEDRRSLILGIKLSFFSSICLKRKRKERIIWRNIDSSRQLCKFSLVYLNIHIGFKYNSEFV